MDKLRDLLGGGGNAAGGKNAANDEEEDLGEMAPLDGSTPHGEETVFGPPVSAVERGQRTVDNCSWSTHTTTGYSPCPTHLAINSHPPTT
jgi:hypothetical protein